MCHSTSFEEILRLFVISLQEHLRLVTAETPSTITHRLADYAGTAYGSYLIYLMAKEAAKQEQRKKRRDVKSTAKRDVVISGTIIQKITRTNSNKESKECNERLNK